MSKLIQAVASACLAYVACAPQAMAQSGVVINGSLDMGLYKDAGKWNVGSISRNTLAFSGQEDLGNGLAATFRLATRFFPDTGALEGTPDKPFWHSESTVGLKGGFGKIKFGRALEAINDQNYQFDPWDIYDSITSPLWDLGTYLWPSDPQANNGKRDYGRQNNGIFYESPQFGPVRVHLSGSPEKRPGDTKYGVSGAAVYEQGPVVAMLGLGRNSFNAKETFVGLRYNFSDVSLMGVFDRSTAGSSTAKVVSVGAEYRINLVTLKAGYGQLNLDGVTEEKIGGLTASYRLSKRTRVYTDFGRRTFAASPSRNSYGVGINHSF